MLLSSLQEGSRYLLNMYDFFSLEKEFRWFLAHIRGPMWGILVKKIKISENNQKMPQSHTTDQPMAP